MKTESFGVMCKSEGEVYHVLTRSIKATARNRRGVVKSMVFPGVSTQSHTPRNTCRSSPPLVHHSRAREWLGGRQHQWSRRQHIRRMVYLVRKASSEALKPCN